MLYRFYDYTLDEARRELRRPNRSWRVDESYVKVAGNWEFLFHYNYAS